LQDFPDWFVTGNASFGTGDSRVVYAEIAAQLAE
jgi:hypothetical protein